MEFESEILQSSQQIDADFGIYIAQIFVALQHHCAKLKIGQNVLQITMRNDDDGSRTCHVTCQYEFLVRWINIFTATSRFVAHFV